MRIAWRFNPSLWPTLVVLLVLPLFVYLGLWQLDRADQKRTLHREFEVRQEAEAIDLNSKEKLSEIFNELNWRNVFIEGAFSREINILLDNQVVNGVVGYYVYTPFKLKDQDV